MSTPWKRFDGDEAELRYSDLGDQLEMDVHCVGYLRLRHGARVACKRLREERDEARGHYRWMVEHAADQKLDGYRELGARAAAAEYERDAARLELRALEWLCEWCAGDEGIIVRDGEHVVVKLLAGPRDFARYEERSRGRTYASAARALGWEG